MDFSTLEIAGISLLLLIPGIVEVAKRFGVKGAASIALSLILGALFVGLGQAISLALIPTVALPWINVFVTGIGGGLAVSGYYDLVKRTGLLARR